MNAMHMLGMTGHNDAGADESGIAREGYWPITNTGLEYDRAGNVLPFPPPHHSRLIHSSRVVVT